MKPMKDRSGWTTETIATVRKSIIPGRLPHYHTTTLPMDTPKVRPDFYSFNPSFLLTIVSLWLYHSASCRFCPDLSRL